jgi:transcriptional regulator with XRE-family HTH domain
MDANQLSQTDLALKLKVSSAYISQILNGNFNFTLKKLIEIGIVIGKVPALSFVEPKEYWEKNVENRVYSLRLIHGAHFFVKPDGVKPEKNIA